MSIKDKQNKLVEAMKKDPELKKHYKDIEDLNEKQMKQLIKVCTLLNVDQIKQLKVLASKVKTYEADIEADIKDGLHNYSYNNNCYCVKCKQQRNINKRLEEIETQNYENDLNSVKN
jgi:hypothetical protein